MDAALPLDDDHVDNRGESDLGAVVTAQGEVSEILEWKACNEQLFLTCNKEDLLK